MPKKLFGRGGNMHQLFYTLSGLAAGILSGIFGIGGGIILIPILVYVYGLTQQQAQGTSLAAMVPPITLLAAIRYYYSGNVKIGMAIFIAIGFILGGFIGADIVQYVPDPLLRKVFGLILFFVSLRMLFFK